MKKLLLPLLLLLLFSCEDKIASYKKANFNSYFLGYIKGRLACDRANNKTKYQWAIEAKNSYLLTVGHLTKLQAEEVLTEITNRWHNNETN